MPQVRLIESNMETLIYHIVNTEEDYSNFINILYSQNEFVFDFETTSLQTHSTSIQLVGIGFCFREGESYYIPFNGNIDENKVLTDITACMQDPTVRKIGHNIKYDARVLDRFGIRISNIYFDTMVASYALFGDRFRHNLDDITLHHLNHIKIRTKSVIPNKSKKFTNPTMLDTPIEDVARYCNEDCDYTYRLYRRLHKLLNSPENSVQKKLFYEIDMPLVYTLLRMECNGTYLDKNKIYELQKYIGETLVTLKKEIDDLAGREVGLTKPHDISACLFSELKIQDTKPEISVPKNTKGYSTSAAVLELFAGVPIVDKILEYKMLGKLINTYILPLPLQVSDHTGLIHASYMQTATATARLACKEPNLQQLPSRTKVGKRIRGAFVSRFIGGKILAADYSQAELRILAHMGQEEVFLKAYNKDEDVHTAVASEVVYEIPKEQVTKEQRTNCKTVNFGLLYGMRAKKLAATLGIPLEESSKIMDKYMSKMKGLKSFLDDSATFLSKNGYTENYFGRRRYIPKIFSDDKLDQWGAQREGANNCIQSTNAEIIRIAMNKIQDMLESNNYKSIMIMQIHDELVFDIHPQEFHLVDKITDIMENVVKFDVKMKTEAKLGDSWSESH